VKYLMMIKSDERYRSQPIPQALLAAMGPFIEEGFKSGALISTGGLKPSSEGHRIRLSGGKLHLSDGPFTESKEIIGGYAIMEFESKEAALENARQFMELHRVHWPDFECECEVRPMDP
jgi:hypothetical protein